MLHRSDPPQARPCRGLQQPGCCAPRQGRPRWSWADYAEALRLKPDLAEAYNNRGIARGDKGDLDGALADFAEVIRLNPDYAEAYNNREGDLDSALADYAEAIRLKPDLAETYNNRALARRAKSAPASAKAAIADFQKYLDLGGGISRDLKNKL